ncbi:MAG: FHA domain-containing protein [Chloroflexota bacterium]
MMQPNLYLKTEWSDDQKILRYLVYTANTSVMEQWRESVMSHLRNWQGDDTPRILFDLSYPNVSMSYFVLSHRELFNMGITPDGKHEFLSYLDKTPDKDVKLAVVLSNTMLGALSSYVPTSYGRGNFTPRVFFSPDTAEQWLRVETGLALFNTNTLQSDTLMRVMDNLNQNDQDIYGDRDYLRILVNESLEMIPITDGRPIVVGRTRDVDLDLSEFGQLARSVSRRHAQISLSNGRLSIIDLNSRNGTYVSGRKIPQGKAIFIRRDDMIRVGKVEFSVIF